MANDSVGFKLKIAVDEGKKSLKNLNKELDNTKLIVNELGSAIKKAFGKETAIIGLIKSLGSMMNMMMKATAAEAEYVESMNLLAVSYRQDTEEGKRLYNQTNQLLDSMEQILGLDPSKLTQQVGIYKQMTSAMGMTNEQSALLSRNLIKLQQDTASLYNLQSSEVATKFQSALAGQTRAVRSLGVDITQATLQQELYNMGINESITNLNRASKTVLIYLTMQRQLANANGDASRTINSMANQMKIFKEQVAIAGRQLGALFIPILKTILPIANAILMVFNDIMSIILGLFGVDVQTMATEFGQKSVDIGDAFGDVEANIDKSTKAAKKLLGLRGFDKLNNITTPQDSTSGAGGGIGAGGVGGVDSRLLDSLDEYNLHLEDTMNKARKIANWIEKWLIYTDEAGNKHLTTLGKIVTILGVGGLLYKGIKSIYTVVSLISKLTGGTGILGAITKIGTKIGGIAKAIGGLGLGPVLAIIVAAVDYIAKIPKFFEMISTTIDRLKSGQNLIEALLPQSSEELVERLFYTLPLTGLLRLIDEVSGHKLNIDANIDKVAEKLDQVKQWFTDTKNWVSEHIVKPIVGFIKPITDAIYNDLIRPVTGFVETLFKSIFGFIGNVIANVWEVAKGVGEAWWSIYSKIAEIFKKILEIVGAIWKVVYYYIIKPIGEWVGGLFTSIYNNVINPILNVLGRGASWLYDHLIKPIWDKFWWLKGKVEEIFWGILNGVADFGAGVIKGAINGVFNGIEKVINTFIRALNKAIDTINKIPGVDIKAVKELHIKRLADGGFVDEGEMFIAREAGPEMVGTINGRTAVANNDQIVKGITDGVMIGVARAMQQSGGTQKIVIEADGDTEGLLNFITFKQKENERQYGM